MKELKNFTDQELILELRRRKYALAVWSIADVNMQMAELKNGHPKLKNVKLTKEEKYQLIVSTFESDHSNDNEALQDAIFNKLTQKNRMELLSKK